MQYVAGRPPCSSASLTPSLITPHLAYPSAPVASLFAFEHVEQISSSGPWQWPFPLPGTCSSWCHTTSFSFLLELPAELLPVCQPYLNTQHKIISPTKIFFYIYTWICFLHSICHHLTYLFAYHSHRHWMVGYLFLSTLCLLPMCYWNVVGTWNMFLKYMQEFLLTVAAYMIFLRICWEWGKISYAEMKWVGHNLKKNLSITN